MEVDGMAPKGTDDHFTNTKQAVNSTSTMISGTLLQVSGADVLKCLAYVPFRFFHK